ncbi:hypothetical protein ACA910_011027 [Epithemia clementina (nom. ined.)]
MSNSEFLEKLKSLVEVYEHLGGEPGGGKQRMEDFVDEDSEEISDTSNLANIKACARDEYLAVWLLLKSDRKRYGALVDDLINQHT